MLAAVLLAAASAHAAESPKAPPALTLAEAESQACAHSPELAAAASDLEAAQAQASGAQALFWPRLSLEGSWRYATEIPTLTLPVPGAGAVALGDHVNYSLGPMLSWTLWDSGLSYYGWRAAKAGTAAKAAALRAVRREVILETRLAYFRTQLARTRLRLQADALAVAENQEQDIQRRLRAGAAGRIDLLSAGLDVLDRRRERLQAEEAYRTARRELLSKVAPGPEAAADTSASGGAAAVMELDPLADSLARLAAAAERPFGAGQPRLESLRLLAEAAELAAGVAASDHWPRLQVFAKTSLDYPNGPVLETIHQNALGANLSWTLFTGGRTGSRVEEQRQQAAALEARRLDADTAARLRWDQARIRLARLREEAELLSQTVQRTESLAGLVYEAYQAGRLNYLEVQAANLRALGAKTQAAGNQVARLMQLAILDSLSENQEAAP